MLKVGLTGGIGCGKTTATKRFRAWGVPVIEADAIARELVQPGQPALQEIAQLFGTRALLQDGTLDRAWLRQVVFQDKQLLQQLEAILHPRIRQEIITRMTQCPPAPYVVVDVPLLLEKGYTDIFERVLVIDCMPEQQVQRVKMRDGSDDELIAAIMGAQWPRAERLRHATDILDNSSSMADFYNRLDNLHFLYTKKGST